MEIGEFDVVGVSFRWVGENGQLNELYGQQEAFVGTASARAVFIADGVFKFVGEDGYVYALPTINLGPISIAETRQTALEGAYVVAKNEYGDKIKLCGNQCEYQCEEGCEVTCELACEEFCQETCEFSCELACEFCEDTCELECETVDETGCDPTCENTCEDACELNCQETCEIECETVDETGCDPTCEDTAQL